MEEAITQLVNASIEQQEVGTLTYNDGTVLLACPLERGVAIGVGTGPGFERKLRSILRKRTENLPRYGNWMPALFNDGSCFVIMRIPDIKTEGPVLESGILAAAVELIS